MKKVTPSFAYGRSPVPPLCKKSARTRSPKSGSALPDAIEFCTKNKLAIIRYPFDLDDRIELARRLTGQVKRSLLIVPRETMGQWHGYAFSDGRHKRRDKELEAYILAGPGVPIVMPKEKIDYHLNTLVECEFDMIVVDGKDIATGRNFAARALARAFARRRYLFETRPLMLALTGYRQYKFLSNQIFGGVRGFDRDFIEKPPGQPNVVVGYREGTEIELCDRVNPYTWPPVSVADVFEEDRGWKKLRESARVK